MADVKCDRDNGNCPREAVFSYLWDWGEKGVCCAEHGMLLQQTAGQISRTVQLVPIVPAGPVPMTRDERVQAKAQLLVAQEELEEAKGRGLELYRLNTELSQRNRLLIVRESEAAAQLKDALTTIAELEAKLQRRDVEAGELVTELERLRTLERLTQLGVEGGSSSPEAEPGTQPG
jgi:hypothetical protein